MNNQEQPVINPGRVDRDRVPNKCSVHFRDQLGIPQKQPSGSSRFFQGAVINFFCCTFLSAALFTDEPNYIY